MLLLSGGACNQAIAKDFYMGIYADGLEAWLMSETLKMHSLRECEVRVKAVNGGNLVKYIDYKFSGGVTPNGYVETFHSSDGRSGEINARGLDQWSPVEHNIFSYFQKKWSEHISQRLTSFRTRPYMKSNRFCALRA